MRLGRGENKFHRRRRLLQGLQQRIESVLGHLMNFIYDIDLETAFRRLVSNVLDNLPNFVDTTIRSAINFQHIEAVAGGDLSTLRALVTRRWSGPFFAV